MENKKTIDIEKFFLNGYEWWLDREKQFIYDNKESIKGTSIYSIHLTKNEKQQVLDYIKYGC